MERARLACGGRKGGRKGRRDPQGFSRPLTGVCCDGSPERLVDPCLELNLFHDSANLPRLALRLRLRLSALSSRSEQPRSISATSLHFFPMLSSPLLPGQHPGAQRALSPSSRRRVSLQPARRSQLAPPWARQAPAGAPRSVTAAATRLRLRRRLAKLWAGAASATCAPASFLLRPKLLSTPQPPPSLEGARPTLGAINEPLDSYLQSLHPAQAPDLVTNLTPPGAAGASLGYPHWVGGDCI